MSEQAARDFIELVHADQDLASRLNEAASAEERLGIAKEAGYEFTEEEFMAARSRIPDGELETVAGGRACNCTWDDWGL